MKLSGWRRLKNFISSEFIPSNHLINGSFKNHYYNNYTRPVIIWCNLRNALLLAGKYQNKFFCLQCCHDSGTKHWGFLRLELVWVDEGIISLFYREDNVLVSDASFCKCFNWIRLDFFRHSYTCLCYRKTLHVSIFFACLYALYALLCFSGT